MTNASGVTDVQPQVQPASLRPPPPEPGPSQPLSQTTNTAFKESDKVP